MLLFININTQRSKYSEELTAEGELNILREKLPNTPL